MTRPSPSAAEKAAQEAIQRAEHRSGAFLTLVQKGLSPAALPGAAADFFEKAIKRYSPTAPWSTLDDAQKEALKDKIITSLAQDLNTLNGEAIPPEGLTAITELIKAADDPKTFGQALVANSDNIWTALQTGGAKYPHYQGLNINGAAQSGFGVIAGIFGGAASGYTRARNNLEAAMPAVLKALKDDDPTAALGKIVTKWEERGLVAFDGANDAAKDAARQAFIEKLKTISPDLKNKDATALLIEAYGERGDEVILNVERFEKPFDMPPTMTAEQIIENAAKIREAGGKVGDAHVVEALEMSLANPGEEITIAYSAAGVKVYTADERAAALLTASAEKTANIPSAPKIHAALQADNINAAPSNYTADRNTAPTPGLGPEYG